MKAQPAPEEVCEECRRLFDPATGQIVEGWKNAKWLAAGPNLCAGCKDKIIVGLEKSIPVEGGGS